MGQNWRSNWSSTVSPTRHTSEWSETRTLNSPHHELICTTTTPKSERDIENLKPAPCKDFINVHPDQNTQHLYAKCAKHVHLYTDINGNKKGTQACQTTFHKASLPPNREDKPRSTQSPVNSVEPELRRFTRVIRPPAWQADFEMTWTFKITACSLVLYICVYITLLSL